MKKEVLLVFALMLTLLSSCVRSEDLELLKHPIHVQGNVDPYLGVPVAYGEMNLNELLEMLSARHSGLVDPDANIITIQFDTNVTDVIYAAGYNPNSQSSTTAKRRVPTKDVNFVDFIDTVKEYSVDITLFDDARLSAITPGNLAINHLWLNLAAVYQGHCQPGYESMIRDSVRAVVDSLVIKYTGHDYVTSVFALPAVEPIYINDVLERQTLRFDSVDLSPIINSMPRKITVSFRFKFSIDEAWIINNVANPSFSKMMDTLRMTYLEYDADLSVAFPFEIHIGMLPYNFDVALGDGLATVNIDSIISSLGDNIDAELKDSYINLAFDNGIPIDFMISAEMLDADSSYLFEVVNLDTIMSAPVIPLDNNPNTYEASGTTRTIIRAKINSEKLRLLKEARTLRVELALSSGSNPNIPNNPNTMVAVQRTNSLKVKASIQVHPSATIDIPITNSGIIN